MKIFKVFMAIVLFAGVCLAENYTIPKDNNEEYPGDANLVGVTSKYSTTLSTTYVTNASAIVYGFTMYTALTVESTDFAVIYDTDVARADTAFSATNYDKYRVTDNIMFSSQQAPTLIIPALNRYRSRYRRTGRRMRSTWR